MESQAPSKPSKFQEGHWLTRKDNEHRGNLYGKPSPREEERESVLAEWLGEERTPDVFAALRPKFKCMSELIDAFQMDISPAELQKLEEIQKKWSEIAGKDIALQSKPILLEPKARRIRVEVENSSFLTIFKMYQKVLEQRLAFFTQSEFIRLSFVPAGGSAPQKSL